MNNEKRAGDDTRGSNDESVEAINHKRNKECDRQKLLKSMERKHTDKESTPE